ncbi:MAG: type I restriction endonuclease subunit R [Planctomycetes bacterium]|nr:type I restriction endonuclease subunit R [Planctomycetota bacterium]
MRESVVEDAAIEYLKELGYDHLPGPEIAPDGIAPERASYADIVLVERLDAALARINPELDAETLDGVRKQLVRGASPSLEEGNAVFQRWLTRGVDVQVKKDGSVRGDIAWLVDFEQPDNNDWLVVNQFTVVEGRKTRRPDVVVFLNGLPIAVVELKNPTDENATIESAWNQLQTYKDEVPSLFHANELLVVSDGSEARVGSLTAGLERFGPWRTVDGSELAPLGAPQLEVLIRGLFDKRRLLDYIRHFVLWETGDGFVKKIAGYHQFHAVNKAVQQTVRASRPDGDRRAGVIWHTQGSGKSILMAFYAGKLVLHPAMENPTLVVVTDRNDLDGQLFAQFSAAKGILPAPVQAEDRDHLKELLQVASGGIVFTTIQKFGVPKGERYPELSDRRNIVVITDEAHRSQYDFVDGFARNLRDALPKASFIGFTGTPIDFDDKSTEGVFGNYIDTYTISQAVEDNATVPIHYEARLARIALPEERRPKLDEDFEEVTEGEEEEAKGKLKSTWSRIEAMVGTEERLALIAKDIVEHFDRRTEILDGKAMVVTMSRRIAVDLHDQIVSLRPEWAGTSEQDGAIKVVMTGRADDPPELRRHVRSKPALKAVEKRFKDPADSLKLVIVRDMWLTGFDAPCAHTLYVDKPMRGHGLMQAIARVNRVFRDKPAGLVVDYLGLAENLKMAVADFDGGDRARTGVDVEAALEVLQEQAGVVRDMFHGFDYGGYFGAKASDRVAALTGGANFICGRQVDPLSD